LAIEAGDDIEEVRHGGRTYYQLEHRAPGTRMTNCAAIVTTVDMAPLL
jgi:hypothetical protein